MFTINSEIQQIIKEIRKAPNADFYLRDIKYQCDEEGCWDTGLISIYNPNTKYSLTYACHCERGFNYQLSILHWEIENYYKRPFLNFPRPMVCIRIYDPISGKHNFACKRTCPDERKELCLDFNQSIVPMLYKKYWTKTKKYNKKDDDIPF